jgi:membrane-associated phospholipid phosphatase
MLTHLVTRGLAPWRRARRDRDNRRPACRLTVEALEGRLLLSGDMVLRWNQVLWQAEWTAGVFAPVNSRIMAIVQTAVYEAVNSFDGTHTPYVVDIPAPHFASEDAATAEGAATATAAHDTLVAIFPTQKAVLDLELKTSLQDIADGDPKTWGIRVGQAAAQIMLAVRAHDGSDKVVNYIPGTNPGDFNGTPGGVNWPQVTPWFIQSAAQFRPGPPPALTSPEWAAAFSQVKQLGAFDSTTRTADQTEAALFWAGVVAPANFFPLVNQIAANVAVARGNSLVENARMFALLDLALADQAIACFDAKYAYNFWRPITAIRAADQGNPNTEADPNWTPLAGPGGGNGHPSYPSAHSTVMGTAAEVLARYFGTDNIPFSLSWFSLPGVTRSFDSFSAAANECAMSRIWLGIHYSFDITEGLKLGRSVGGYLYQNLLLPRTSPPSPASPGSILIASTHVTAMEGTSITFASVQRADARGAGLPEGRPAVYLVSADGTSKSAASDTRLMELSRARSAGAQPQSRGGSVDDVFGSADPWEERFALAP